MGPASKKKASKATAKAAPSQSPKASPKASPALTAAKPKKASPRATPKATPKASPLAKPAAAKKAATGAKKAAPPGKKSSLVLSHLPNDLPRVYTALLQRTFRRQARPEKGGGAGEGEGEDLLAAGDDDDDDADAAGSADDDDAAVAAAADKTKAPAKKRAPTGPLKDVHLGRPRSVLTPNGAMLMFEVPSKSAAKALHQRLHKQTLFGRTLVAKYGPKATLGECRGVPTVCDVSLSHPMALADIEALLWTLPGVLAVQPLSATGAKDVSAMPPLSLGADADADESGGQKGQRFVATFADEGSALHARAVLSGRRQEGAFVFIKPRPLPDV